MSRSDRTEDPREVARLLDELEQLRTALEASNEEVSEVAEDRDRLRVQLATRTRELQAAKAAHAIAERSVPTPDDASEAQASETGEELQVAFEELEVLAEELEVANASLLESNQALDQRVRDRTQELEAKNLALSLSELRFRTLIESMPQLVWRAEAVGEWTWCSPQWSDYTGQTLAESLGQGWLSACHPDDRDRVSSAWAEAEACDVLDFEVRIHQVRGSRYRHHRARAARVRTDDGDVAEWVGTCTDVDDLVSLQDQQAVLVGELQHRTRNLMSVVQATVHRTTKSSASLQEFTPKITERLGALTRVQALLSRRDEGRRVAFDSLLRTEIGAHMELDADGQGEQVVLSGPREVGLYSATVQALALGLHELTTNAVKYGAFATPEGRLTVDWHVEDAPGGGRRLKVDWRESGVRDMPAPGATPRGGGYGRELIERALPYQLGAETTYAFGADGVRCTIAVDIA